MESDLLRVVDDEEGGARRRPSKFGSERSGVGPEFEKGDGRLRPSLQQRLPGAEGPPEGRSTAPRHAACGGPIPRSRGPVLLYLRSFFFLS